jgi:hypothetical protein
VNLRYTRHQVARGARADAEVGDKLYLLKRVAVLHATYQVRLLAFRAQQEGKRLVVRVPPTFKAGPSLRDLMRELKSVIRIEKSEE